MKKYLSDINKISTAQAGDRGVQKNVKNLLKQRLQKELLLILEKITQVANRSGVVVFAVGGFIRDLL